MIAYLHMKQEKFDPDGYYGFLILVQSVKRTLARYISGKILAERLLLLSELLKEQYDYEVTAVPGDFSVGSPVLQISPNGIMFLWLIAAMGAFLETTERNGKNCLRKESCI